MRLLTHPVVLGSVLLGVGISASWFLIAGVLWMLFTYPLLLVMVLLTALLARKALTSDEEEPTPIPISPTSTTPPLV